VDAFPFEEDAKAPVAEAAPLGHQAPEPLAQVAVAEIGLSAHGLGIDPDELAGGPLRETALGHQAEHGLTACRTRR
jgi:hypothetical protein